ncbi:hypothetical protein [Pontixanthobacter sp. CEM42]|uniref:hypothetical protein n=1 Tax=Pontixanthobacter sp. CEM42 TaxID=2792077 RepID=UPI001AE0AD7B|nr:hypothetical protein [Pontixanthobacter sp. CEM42]
MTILSGLFVLLAITFASIAVAFLRMPQLVDPKLGRVTAILFIVAAVLFVLIGFLGFGGG